MPVAPDYRAPKRHRDPMVEAKIRDRRRARVQIAARELLLAGGYGALVAGVAACDWRAGLIVAGGVIVAARALGTLAAALRRGG